MKFLISKILEGLSLGPITLEGREFFGTAIRKTSVMRLLCHYGNQISSLNMTQEIRSVMTPYVRAARALRTRKFTRCRGLATARLYGIMEVFQEGQAK